MEVQDQESLARWDGLGSRDASSRNEAMENICQEVMRRVEAIGPIPAPAPSPPASVSPPNSDLNDILAHLLMLASRCPFEDVKERSIRLLQAVQDLGVRIPRPLGNGPSRFIPEKEILQVSKVDARTQSIFEDAFAALRRLDNISLVMGFHPQYLESFLRTQHYLLQMDGPLSLHYRHYIGIMAAARHQCSYLVNLHVNDFLQVGGDLKWLNGLDEAPQKLQQLGELNKILAHRPWLLTKEHIERLLKAEEHSWSLAELIHAVVLLTHYHSLASFTFGCGIMPEIHCDGGHTFRPPSLSQYCVCDIANGNGHANHHDDLFGNQEVCGEVEVLMERMKQLQECRDDEEASQEEMATRFEREKTESMLVVTAEDEEGVPSRDISRHFEDPSYGYKDFSRRGEHVPTLRVQDYSWEDHGFSLVNRLYPDVGQMLDEKFQMAYNLTYNTMATHKDVDTSMLRRAIWNYIHCMFGIRYVARYSSCDLSLILKCRVFMLSQHCRDRC
ncbi:putative sestrin-1 isoform 3 [Scophthalmus maximus]|uniref:Putative sestrin-1 isoform 3 n=1 Tax=Scophthalmus maximus TaxID=52904 RepID=A0A2U9CVT8_SCOMX|nr:putative sestrin-1 isoform 3 [Scophthalmus maximus]